MAKAVAGEAYWVPDKRFVPRLAVSKDMGDEMVKIAREGLAFAEASAPRPPGYRRTGKYAASFKIGRRIEKQSGMRRQVARVENKDHKAWAVEWGNGAHHILGKTAKEMRKGL